MISPEKIRALDAFVREGTFEKAARMLGVTTSGVVYLINALDERAGISRPESIGIPKSA